MPRMAWTSRIDGRRWRLIMRSSAVAAVPLSAPEPYTRYTTCRSSTTTIGSATAVPRLRPPEEHEANHHRQQRPAHRVQPQGGLADYRVAVGAVVDDLALELRRRDMEFRRAAVHRAPQRVVGVVARHADALLRQQGVPDQRDVDGGGVDLQQIGQVLVVVQRLARDQRERGRDAEDDARGVQPGADDERQQLADVVEARSPAGQDEGAPDVEQGLEDKYQRGEEPVPGGRLAVGENDHDEHDEREQQLLQLDDHVAEWQAAARERKRPDQWQVLPHHRGGGDAGALGEVEHEDAGDQERDVARHTAVDVQE